MFDPLGTLRALRDDPELTTTEFAILVAAALRTDNKTGRVRCSQAMLAEDANLTDRAVRYFYRSAACARYLETWQNGRRKELSWIPEPGSSEEPIEERGSPLLPIYTSTSSQKPVREEFSNTEEYLRALESWNLGFLGKLRA